MEPTEFTRPTGPRRRDRGVMELGHLSQVLYIWLSFRRLPVCWSGAKRISTIRRYLLLLQPFGQ